MLPLNNDTSDTDQSIEMVRFQCGPGSRDACRINILFNRKELIMEEDEILKYSMQIAMLKQSLRKELINEKEYEKIKKKLMEEYKIVSDLVI